MADEGHEAQRVKTGQSIDAKTGEFGYPSGHLGHLSNEQQLALVEFKELAEQDKLYTPASDGKPASHEDVTLLRFLRARRFKPQDALGQFKDTENWRKENHINDLYDNIDIADYEQTRQLYPQWTGRRDKRGIPVYCFEVAPLNSKTMSAYLKSSETTKVLNVEMPSPKDKAHVPPRLLRLFALYENLVQFTMPLCTKLTDRPHPDTPISQSNNIVDISKVGLKQFWNLRSHMQDASQLATAHYPETLDRIFIVGAPSFFPTVWGWIKRWFDPITTSKIFILTESNAYKTLSSFIEPQNIPKKYGGQLDWNWGDKPKLDPEESAHLKFNEGMTTWPQGPMRWVQKSHDEWDLQALGSENGKERREIIGHLNFDEVQLSKAASRQSTRPPTSAPAAQGSMVAPAAPITTDVAAATGLAPAAVTSSANGDAIAPAMSAMDIKSPSNPVSPSNLSLASEDTTTQNTPRIGPGPDPIVEETAPIPPQPMITPEVPLNAVATDLPAATPSEEPKQL